MVIVNIIIICRNFVKTEKNVYKVDQKGYSLVLICSSHSQLLAQTKFEMTIKKKEKSDMVIVNIIIICRNFVKTEKNVYKVDQKGYSLVLICSSHSQLLAQTKFEMTIKSDAKK